MKEIGSIYSVQTLEKRSCPSIDLAGEGAVYFSLCREALLVIARRYRSTAKKVLIPAYTCQTVLDPFLQEDWEICYYNIDKKLRIDTDDLKSKYSAFNPTLCIAHPYYGADLNEKELEGLGELKRKGCVLVEDLTQCVFSKQYSSIFDFFVGSYRKWFPIPDGAFMIGCLDDNHEMQENSAFVEPMSDAMYLRGVFHRTGDNNIKEISRRVGNMAISHISGGIVPHKISNFSTSLLNEIDVEGTMKKRRDNYQYLYEQLSNSSICTPVERSLDELTCAPLFFPVYVQDRALFQKKLAQQEIYAPVLWPVHTDSLLINDGIKQMYNELLMLPIDQRYDESDMERMVAVIKS